MTMSPSTTSLFAIRHAPTNTDGRCVGQTDVLPALTPAAAYADIVGEVPEVDVIWTSPLGRCRMLAEEIGRVHNTQVVVDRRLLEISFGAWENRTWDELKRTDGERVSMDGRLGEPAAPGGENPADMTARVSAWQREIHEIHEIQGKVSAHAKARRDGLPERPAPGSPDDVQGHLLPLHRRHLLVAHAGVVRTLWWRCKASPGRWRWPSQCPT